MEVRGWDRRYSEILRRFGYSRRRDEEAARLLDAVLRKGGGAGGRGGRGQDPRRLLRGLISKRPVIVAGAGPSLPRSLPVLKRHAGVTSIAADSAAGFLVRNGVFPDVVVTDLDGDAGSLARASRRCVMVVHAHGGNMGRIPMAAGFPRCIGTTQSRPFGGISNFGGFTDGDRAVFLASHFGAERVVLLGMDFGDRVGRHSGTRRSERPAKLKKLREAESLLEWLSARGGPRMYSISRASYAERVTPAGVDGVMAA